MSEVFRVYAPEECGADGYPKEWHASIKQLVRVLADHRCVRCLHPYLAGRGEWSLCDSLCRHSGPTRTRTVLASRDPIRITEARWRILTVHHLDGITTNCMWWNLVALCQRCHLQIQGKVRLEQTYPFEHSDWFRPYVAGFYAWSYLGEYLPRSETEARMKELLALEGASA